MPCETQPKSEFTPTTPTCSQFSRQCGSATILGTLLSARMSTLLHQGELLLLLQGPPGQPGSTTAPAVPLSALGFVFNKQPDGPYHVPVAILSAKPSQKLYKLGTYCHCQIYKQEKVRPGRLSDLAKVIPVELEAHAKAVWQSGLITTRLYSLSVHIPP